MTPSPADPDWETEFQRGRGPFPGGLGHKARRRRFAIYLRGQMTATCRRCATTMARELVPEDAEQLHRFVSTSPWDSAPVEAQLVRAAQAPTGGRAGPPGGWYLVVDDTALVKRGPLRARFALARVRVADGPQTRDGQGGPGESVWLICEERAGGERTYYVSNRAACAGRQSLAASVKSRGVCEQAHRQMKQELGLNHYEGRSWSGLHHHCLPTPIAYAFLQHLRLQGRKNFPGATPLPVPRRRRSGAD